MIYRDIFYVMLLSFVALRPSYATIYTPSDNKNLRVGVCRPVANADGVAIGLDHALVPIADAVGYLWKFDKGLAKLSEDERRRVLDIMEKSAVISLIERPKHGSLTKNAEVFSNKPEAGLDFYKPRPGDMNKDGVSYFVKIGNYRIKLVYSIFPVNQGVVSEELVGQLCGHKGAYYRP